MRSEILVATTNAHKLREIAQVLGGRVQGVGVRVNENGKTFEANAIKKVKAIKLKPNQIAIADDSGLCVDCLGGKPGVKSARYANPPTPQNLCWKLLRQVRSSELGDRRAHFVCVIAIKYPSGKIETVRGVCRGKIIHEMRGEHGFGYDPIFVPAGYKKTFAEVKPAMKNRLSHRGRALRQLKAVLAKVIE
ncbi:MAG: RdgB/HAM1 family non-canonical purine NTP pyrophosphatase [Candidatus Margulisbacteria bacterium]|nr:RdgB/HAM1 family non-canonical purine NTP pyrophosphatase [Candidatus Margulisiibacteriota bacterium]